MTRRRLVPHCTIWLIAGCQFPAPADIDLDAATDAPIDARDDLTKGRAFTRFAGVAPSVDVATASVADGTTPVRVLVPDESAATGFRELSATAAADGTFVAEGTPASGEIVLQIGRSYWATLSRDLTIRTTVPLSHGHARATQPTPVQLTLRFTEELGANQLPQLVSSQGNLTVDVPSTPGDAIANTLLDWSTVYGQFAPNFFGTIPNPNDDFHAVVHQIETDPLGYERRRIIAATALTSSGLRDGHPSNLDAVLSVIPTQTTIPAQTFIDRSAFLAGQSPQTSSADFRVTCLALPIAATPWGPTGEVVTEPSVASFRSSMLPATRRQSMSLAGTFADPFPPSWPRYCVQAYRRTRLVALPSRAPASISAQIVRITSTSGPFDTTPMPAPTNVKIGGFSADDGGLLRASDRPVRVEWSAPPQARQTTVTLLQLRPMGSGTRAIQVATFTTSAAHADLPAEAFTGVEFFAIAVTAFSTPNDYSAGDLVAEGLPGQAAGSVSALFRWSGTCGDGRVDAGEACDNAGEPSASCDADCTAPVCGDGTRNSAAGEVCDTVADSIACDVDCTANACGDGHLNRETEECDDGGTASGDGCSALCVLEPTTRRRIYDLTVRRAR